MWEMIFDVIKNQFENILTENLYDKWISYFPVP